MRLRGAAGLVAALIAAPVPAAFLTTTTAGDLVFEAIAGAGATSLQEFGLGTPALDSLPSERLAVFTFSLVSETLVDVTPAAVVNMGHFAAGSALDFYQRSSYAGGYYAFSSRLASSPSASDLVVFRDTDLSLGLGGSVVESIGVDDWIFHLDDAASFLVDDDDNEMVFRLRVIPRAPLPEPAPLVLLLPALALLRPWRDWTNIQ